MMSWRVAPGLFGIICAFMPLLAVYAEQGPKGEGLDSLPPSPVLYPMKPDSKAKREVSDKAIDVAGLAHELEVLQQIKQRVKRRMLEGRITGMTKKEIEDYLAQEEAESKANETGDQIVGEPIKSRHLQMQVTRWKFGAIQVTANIRRERIKIIYTELITTLADRSFDDQQVSGVRKLVSFHVKDEPWERALTSLLGQAGLGWRLNGSKVVIFELSREERQRQDKRRLAQEAFRIALQGGGDAHAAQAAYLLAQQDHKDKHLPEALSRYLEVIRQFGDQEDQESVRRWVRLARQGIGDVLTALGQFREARTVYLNYISVADPKDPDLPRIRLAAAKASRHLAKGGPEHKPDPSAAGRAQDLLQALIQEYRSKVAHHAVVSEALVNLGELLFDKGEYAAAKEQFEAYAEMQGGRRQHLLVWYLAECDFQLGLNAIRDRRFNAGDRHLLDARNGYDTLTEALRTNRTDQLIDQDIYQQAFFKMGLCYLNTSEPRFEKALFDFMRARQYFQNKPLEGRILVHICRCYAELQREEQLVKNLFSLLQKDVLTNDAPGNLKMEDLLGSIETNLDGYGGSIRSKVLFYIAQSRVREATWNKLRRETLLGKSIHTYERILDDAALASDLRMVAKIGLSRAALMAGDDERAVGHLKEVIKSKNTHRRDAALAMQLLLDHYRGSGRLDDAIRDYEAYVGGTTE